jgi:hypothetical protein
VPDCIVEVQHVPLTFECCAELAHADLVLINAQVFLAFACLEHESGRIAARRRLDRDPAGLERRHRCWTWARVGHPPLPMKPLRTGTAAQRLVREARAWAADRAEDGRPRALTLDR